MAAWDEWPEGNVLIFSSGEDTDSDSDYVYPRPANVVTAPRCPDIRDQRAAVTSSKTAVPTTEADTQDTATSSPAPTTSSEGDPADNPFVLTEDRAFFNAFLREFTTAELAVMGYAEDLSHLSGPSMRTPYRQHE